MVVHEMSAERTRVVPCGPRASLARRRARHQRTITTATTAVAVAVPPVRAVAMAVMSCGLRRGLCQLRLRLRGLCIGLRLLLHQRLHQFIALGIGFADVDEHARNADQLRADLSLFGGGRVQPPAQLCDVRSLLTDRRAQQLDRGRQVQ
jgi:hypothetical protein